jgi:hypothetical protein
MELQNYFAQVGMRKKVKDVAKYIAEEVRPDERDEALFAIFLEVEDVLKKKGDSFSSQFTCSELLEKLFDKSRDGRYLVAVKDGSSVKLMNQHV